MGEARRRKAAGTYSTSGKEAWTAARREAHREEERREERRILELEERDQRYMAEAYERLTAGRVAPELLDEYRQLQLEHSRLIELARDLPAEQEARLIQLDRIIRTAVPDEEVRQYLVANYDYGRDDELAIPDEIYWDIVADVR